MNYFINKNSTLNPLKMELIQDGRNDYKSFHEKIQNADIYFSMVDIVDGSIKISKQPAGCMLKTDVPPDSNEEYYIVYHWRDKDTNRAGTYKGFFTIIFEDGTLIAPIRSDLYIHILDGGIKK